MMVTRIPVNSPMYQLSPMVLNDMFITAESLKTTMDSPIYLIPMNIRPKPRRTYARSLCGFFPLYR